MHICWDSPREKTGLWQLPVVSSVFKDTSVKKRFPYIFLIDFTMTKISIVFWLLNLVVCAIHYHRRYSYTNVCAREIGCCQLRVYVHPLFAEFPWWEEHPNKQTNKDLHGMGSWSSIDGSSRTNPLEGGDKYHTERPPYKMQGATLRQK